MEVHHERRQVFHARGYFNNAGRQVCYAEIGLSCREVGLSSSGGRSVMQGGRSVTQGGRTVKYGRR